MPFTIRVDATFLHSPDRADQLLAVEDHITTAAALTRATWLLLSEVLFGLDGSVDPRNRDAVEAVAYAAADHASAAETLIAALPGGLRDVLKVQSSGPA